MTAAKLKKTLKMSGLMDPEDCPELWSWAELFMFKMFCSNPLLQHTSGSKDSGPEDTDSEIVSRKVNSRRQQHKLKEDKLAVNEKQEVALKVVFAYEEKKDDRK